MIYFTSDLHFGHDNIIKYCERPFPNVAQMDLAMIHNWNMVVGTKDDVYILGDFSFYKDKERNKSILETLNGKKHLIIGNHDYNNVIPEECFVEIIPYKELKFKKKFFVMCHYPILSWNKKHHGAIHLYGHTHNTDLGDFEKQKCLNVGVDNHNFTPISIDFIIEKFKEETNE